MAIRSKTAAPPEPRDNPTMRDGCAACGTVTESRKLARIEGRDMLLCADPVGCCRRYRRGLTASMFAVSVLRPARFGMVAS